MCAAEISAPAIQNSLQGLPLYLGLIGVTGGFLFHIIWEANSRYIFLYSLLLMPYCAMGLSGHRWIPMKNRFKPKSQ